jgi:putative peptidoglycan lipid II flippase
MADIAKGVRSFTMGTAVSRVLGLVREQVFGVLFGAGLSTDAFQAAFRIPNTLRDLFAENALSSAFVPVLAAQKGKDGMNRFASNIFNTLLLIVGLVSVAGIFLSPWLARFIAPGFIDSPGKLALTGRLTAILFPFLLFIALAAWAMSVLNTEGEFFVPSLAPAFFNVFSILVPIALFAVLTRRGMDPIYGAALGVAVGGFIQFAIQWPQLRKRGFRYSAYLSFKDPEFRKVMGLFVPVAIGLSGSRINFLVNTMLISSLPAGSLSWLNYAYRIMHLPLGLFGIAIGTVALPSFSRLAADGRSGDLQKSLLDSLKMVFFLTVPTTVLIAVLAHPVTSAVYEIPIRGSRFQPSDAAATAAVLLLYMLGVPFMSALRNVAGVFYAHKDARRPVIASFIGVAVNLALNISLKGVLGIRAFPISATIAAAVNVGILYAWLPGKIGRFDSRPLFGYLARLTASAAAGGAAAWALAAVAGRVLAGPASSRLAAYALQLATVCVCGVVGIVVFYGASRLLRLEEVRDYVRRFLRF